MLLNFRLFFLCCHLAFDVRHPGLVAASRLGSWTVSFSSSPSLVFLSPFRSTVFFFPFSSQLRGFLPCGFPASTGL